MNFKRSAPFPAKWQTEISKAIAQRDSQIASALTAAFFSRCCGQFSLKLYSGFGHTFPWPPARFATSPSLADPALRDVLAALQDMDPEVAVAVVRLRPVAPAEDEPDFVRERELAGLAVHFKLVMQDLVVARLGADDEAHAQLAEKPNLRRLGARPVHQGADIQMRMFPPDVQDADIYTILRTNAFRNPPNALVLRQKPTLGNRKCRGRGNANYSENRSKSTNNVQLGRPQSSFEIYSHSPLDYLRLHCRTFSRKLTLRDADFVLRQSFG
ncbi:MAG: hypothetical protein OXC26_14970 [Albidovulum sp.]|nr:hypothetical protein [Albidovulum sp.]